MWFATVTIMAIAILSTACDGNPVQPSRLTSTNSGGPAVVPSTTVTITGRVVDEHGNGVAAATVFTYQAGSVRADDEGRYSLEVPSTLKVIEAKVEYPGYEHHARFLHPVSTPQNFLLRDIIRMAPGDSRRLTVTPQDSHYGFDFEYKRRTVRVVSPADAMVEFEVLADDPRHIEGLAFGVMPNYPCCGDRMTLSMRAGQEVSVHVLMSWTAIDERNFTLVSRIFH